MTFPDRQHAKHNDRRPRPSGGWQRAQRGWGSCPLMTEWSATLSPAEVDTERDWPVDGHLELQLAAVRRHGNVRCYR